MLRNTAFDIKRWKTILLFNILIVFLSSVEIQAQSNALTQKGKIVQVRVEGLKLIEQGLVYATISSQPGSQLFPKVVVEDIKALYKLGYFEEVSVDIEVLGADEVVLIFRLSEKPRIGVIELTGNTIIDSKTLKEKFKVFKNNMIDKRKINQDVKMILEEYHKKGYVQTQVNYEIKKIDKSNVSLTYKVSESPKVFLTEINITGTKVYPALDIERILLSSEVDCFSWVNDSGVFQETKINQDLQVITQHYLQNGYIKVKIDKPKAVLIRNPDYSKVVVDFHITEGDQYFTGKIDVLSSDGNALLFDKAEMLKKLNLQSGEVFNPYKQNGDRYKVNDVYLEQGYAFSRVRVSNNVHDDTKTVDVTFHITRGEKAYIGRVEIQGNYETLDSVVRRELEIHDNELYNGLKLRESQKNITRLGFFQAGSGVHFDRSQGGEENTLDYNIILNEGQTGAFNASLTYSGQSGMALVLSASKKNFLGTGRTLTFSTEQKDEGDSRYDFSMVNPYWLDTDFTNSFGIYSTYSSETYYDVRTSGFYYGLSYPIWKNWKTSTTYAWKDEDYSEVTDTGETLLDGVDRNTFRSLSQEISYSTVNHPLFPSNGYEASFNASQYGGALLGGTTEYRSYSFNTRYFKTLNDSGTIVFGVKFNWSHLQQTNSNKEIPDSKRYTIGGITTVRGFDWNEIEGPAGQYELPDGFDIKKKYPYRGDYDVENCSTDPECSAASETKNKTRQYYESHVGGITKRILNVQMYFPLTREGQSIRGLIFFDAGNVWAEDKMYDITGVEKDEWYYRKSIGTGVNLVTPMGVLRFEYGIKLDRKKGESAGRFDFHISGLF